MYRKRCFADGFQAEKLRKAIFPEGI